MKTHPLNVSPLVFGLFFLGLAGFWALRETGAIDNEATRWIIPLLLVGAGAVGVVAWSIKSIRPTTTNDSDGGTR